MDQVFIRSHTESAVHQACRFPATDQAQPCEQGSGREKCRLFGLEGRTESYAT